MNELLTCYAFRLFIVFIASVEEETFSLLFVGLFVRLLTRFLKKLWINVREISGTVGTRNNRSDFGDDLLSDLHPGIFFFFAYLQYQYVK